MLQQDKKQAKQEKERLDMMAKTLKKFLFIKCVVSLILVLD
jgi:hypothetical protein